MRFASYLIIVVYLTSTCIGCSTRLAAISVSPSEVEKEIQPGGSIKPGRSLVVYTETDIVQMNFTDIEGSQFLVGTDLDENKTVRVQISEITSVIVHRKEHEFAFSDDPVLETWLIILAALAAFQLMDSIMPDWDL